MFALAQGKEFVLHNDGRDMTMFRLHPHCVGRSGSFPRG